jgi:hypothetical protein
MGAGIGKSVKYRSESPSRRTSADTLYHTRLYAAQRVLKENRGQQAGDDLGPDLAARGTWKLK